MVLQAKRNYRKLVVDAELAMEKVVVQPQVELGKSPEYLAQAKEFEAFLSSEASKNNSFLIAMRKRHTDGELFTSNMVSAIRKCMDKQKEVDAAPKTLHMITLDIPQFLMLEMNLESRVVSGEVLRETDKAWLIRGHADMVENLSWCIRCGKELKEPASQVTGMGRTCAKNMGIPYDAKGVLSMSKKERAAIRKQFQAHLKQQTFERWLPKSRCGIINEKKIQINKKGALV